MVKFIVLRGKVSKGGKTYRKGDTFDMAVKDAELLPRSMIRRVTEPSAPAPKKEVIPEPEPPEPPEPEPEVADKPEEEKIRVTI